MSDKFDWARLRKTCGRALSGLTATQASNTVLELGPLACWLLRPDVFRRAVEDPYVGDTLRQRWRTWCERPHVSGTYGTCWVVFVTDRSADLPLIREAFVLPLRWVRDAEHSARLPVELEELAKLTVKSMRDAMAESRTCWGLQLAGQLGSVELRELHVAPESGWAPLAAGLYLAAQGGVPDPTVWATGSWSFSDGLLPVEDIGLKSRLAAEFGARLFFVPEGQQPDESSDAPVARGLQLAALRTGTLLPSRALAELLRRLDAPPASPSSAADEDAVDRCTRYYLRQPLDRPETKAFYVERLLPTIIQRRCGEVRPQYPEWRPTHLVTIVSGSPELVELTARALDVDQCLLLHTPDKKQGQLAEQAKDRLEDEASGRKRIGGSCGAFDNDSGVVASLERRIGTFIAGLAPEKIVFDLTPGTKLMTYALSRLAPPGSWLVYIQHVWRDGRPVPDTERFHAWQVGPT